jgi:hypothetical protein
VGLRVLAGWMGWYLGKKVYCFGFCLGRIEVFIWDWDYWRYLNFVGEFKNRFNVGLV